jgi:uncharacterized membrane protein (Fun14 family)
MKKSVTAALLSLLVFPGTGHVWLNKRKAGFAIIFINLIALLILLVEISQVVMDVLGDINSGLIDINPDQLTATIMAHLANNSGSLNTALIFLIVCWIASTLDAFRIGLQKS